MNLTAVIPTGVTELTVNGLTQWDYGRKLEIHADDLPALIEVHFACVGMESAVVRSCAVINGVTEAAIPDQCLEQTNPITAWVFWVDETSGNTYKTITMPITPRTRPQPTNSIPTVVSDRYTELIGAVNAQVETLKDGSVVVNRALNANKATTAANATTAATAASSNMLNLGFTQVNALFYDIADSGLYLVEIGNGDPAYETFTSLLLISRTDLSHTGTSARVGYGNSNYHIWASYEANNNRIYVSSDQPNTIEGLQILRVAHISY